MSYALENALFQWEEGERRIAEADPRERPQLERVTRMIVGELRRRLGGQFGVEELADLYAAGTDWAGDIARTESSGTDTGWIVDAAFWRYAREAYDFAGGRLHRVHRG